MKRRQNTRYLNMAKSYNIMLIIAVLISMMIIITITIAIIVVTKMMIS